MLFDTQYDLENFNSFKILLYSINSKELLERIFSLLKRTYNIGNSGKEIDSCIIKDQQSITHSLQVII